MSDFWPHGAVAELYGVLRPEGYTERAIFIIDREGIIRYIDIHDIDDQPDNDELFKQIRRIDPQAATAFPETSQVAVDLPHGGIVMYCTSWCPDCKQARLWLQKHNLQYTEVDINRVPGARQYVRSVSAKNLITPTFDIDGKIVVDFDPAVLREVLHDRLSN